MSSRTVNIYLLRATDGHSLLTTIVFVYKLFTLIYYAGDYLVLSLELSITASRVMLQLYT
jgi:hypothetical protein